MNSPLTRRAFLASLAAAVPAVKVIGAGLPPTEDLPPVRAITKGPRFHWRGYYDKLLFDETNRYVLTNRVGFEHRSPGAEDEIRVGMVDLHNGDHWIELGKSCAWNWQQGCMLQWVPRRADEVLWNDRQEGQFVCHILNVKTGRQRTLPHAIYTISPDGRYGLSTDFRRLNDCRPGYGYAGIPDPNRELMAPTDAGIWKVDLATGASKLLISIAEIAAIPWEGQGNYTKASKSWFNHLLYNPDGSRFVFLHRFRNGTERKFCTRMFTASAKDGGERFIIDPSGETSHFIWRDSEHVFLFTKHESAGLRFYVFKDKSRNVEVVGPDVMTVNGHNTHVPGTKDQWVLNDTYPDKQRLQHPYLYHIPTNRRVALGHLYLPPEYKDEWRCDTHPCASRDGKLVTIDSPHGGNGRQVYLIDIGKMVKG